MADSGLVGNIFSRFIQWLYSSGNIVVPTEFHERCKSVVEIVDSDCSGVVNTLLNYAIQSASDAKYRIECGAENKTIQELLNKWLQEINLDTLNIPTGLASLAKEYFKERWAGSSFCVLKVADWQEISVGQTSLVVPTTLWFVNGSSIYVKRPKDKSYTIGSDEYFLDEKFKVKLINSKEKEYVTIQKPFNRWFDEYSTPYLIRNGVYKNWAAMKILQDKGNEVLTKVIPYLFMMTKGTEGLFDKGVDYNDTELTAMVDAFRTEVEKYQSASARTPAHGVPFDQKYEHLIPDLTKIINEELYRQGYRAMLAGMGFIDVIQGLSSTRKESVLNPKPFLAEINDGVEGFKLMLLDVVYQIAAKNKAHKKLFSDKGSLLITNKPLKINVEQMLDDIRSGFDRGPISIQSYLGALGFDLDTEKEQRQKEAESGLEDLMYPHIISNQEEKGIDTFQPTKPCSQKQENLEKEGKKPNSPESKKYKNADIELAECDRVQCRNCQEEFVYLSVPEAGMGYVKCPNCQAIVLQNYYAEAKIEEKGNHFRVRQVDPSEFEEDSFRTIWISKSEGIKAIIGRRKGATTTSIQSLLFEKEKWDVERIKEWIKNHKDRFHAYVEIAEANLDDDLIEAPYKSNSELPKSVKKYPAGAQTAFREAFNEALKEGKGEDYAFPVAWTSLKRWLKKHGYKKIGTNWIKKSQEDLKSEELKDKQTKLLDKLLKEDKE